VFQTARRAEVWQAPGLFPRDDINIITDIPLPPSHPSPSNYNDNNNNIGYSSNPISLPSSSMDLNTNTPSVELRPHMANVSSDLHPEFIHEDLMNNNNGDVPLSNPSNDLQLPTSANLPSVNNNTKEESQLVTEVINDRDLIPSCTPIVNDEYFIIQEGGDYLWNNIHQLLPLQLNGSRLVSSRGGSVVVKPQPFETGPNTSVLIKKLLTTPRGRYYSEIYF